MAEVASVPLFGGANGRERRATQRKSLLDISLVAVDLNPGAYGLMLDISESGARVQAMGAVEPGAKVQIAFQVPGLSKRIEGIGSVKWTDQDGRVGVCFESLQNTNTEELKQWIETLSQAKESTTEVESPAPSLDFSEYVANIPNEFRREDSDVDSILQFLVEKVVERTPVNGSAIALGTPEKMVCRASSGVAPEIGTRISSDSALSAECLRTARVVKCDDTETDPRVNPNICRQLSLRSLLIVPFLFEGQVRGLLELFSPEPKSFDNQHVALLEELAKYASQMLFGPESAREWKQEVAQETVPGLSIENTTLLASPTENVEEPISLRPATTEAKLSSTAAAAPAPALLPGIPPKIAKPPLTSAKPKAVALSAAPQVATLPSPVHEEPEARSQTRRSLLAVVLVVVLLVALSGVGWWYGVRMSRKTPAAAPVSAATTQSQPAPQTPSQSEQQQAAVVPASSTVVTESVRLKSTRLDEDELTAEDTLRTNGLERRLPSSVLEISPASGPAKKNEEGAIVAPSLGNLEANQSMGSVELPAYAARPALRAPSNVSGGQLLQRVEPTYPMFARQQRYQGDVVLSIHITKAGTVENIRRVSGNPMLTRAAIDAVKRWRYEPYKLNGEPQELDTTVTIKFKLPN